MLTVSMCRTVRKRFSLCLSLPVPTLTPPRPTALFGSTWVTLASLSGMKPRPVLRSRLTVARSLGALSKSLLWAACIAASLSFGSASVSFESRMTEVAVACTGLVDKISKRPQKRVKSSIIERISGVCASYAVLPFCVGGGAGSAAGASVWHNQEQNRGTAYRTLSFARYGSAPQSRIWIAISEVLLRCKSVSPSYDGAC